MNQESYKLNLRNDYVFKMMHSEGYYPTPMAEEKKVQQVKQQYSQCAK